jgi:hypothetical protein
MPKTVYYVSKESPISNAQAQVLGPELERIAKANGSKLRPGALVKAATPKSSPIHDIRFVWDDKIAGHRYRLDQAREIIAAVKIRIVKRGQTEPEQPIREWLNIVDADGDQYYQSIRVVARSKAKTAHVIDEALDRLQLWTDRYNQYRTTLPGFEEKFQVVFAAVERVKEGGLKRAA